MFKVRHLQSGEIISSDNGEECIYHRGYTLMIGFDGKIYWVVAGDGGLYVEDVSNEYELIINYSKVNL